MGNKIDTRRLDRSARAAFEGVLPPRRNAVEDAHRKQTERWAHLGQVHSEQVDGRYVFSPVELDYIYIAERRLSKVRGQCKEWSFILQDTCPHDDLQRYDADGTFYNLNHANGFVIVPARGIQRLGSKLKIISDGGAWTKENERKHERVHDSYVFALGQMRHLAFTKRRKYIPSFQELDKNLLELVNTLSALVLGTAVDEVQLSQELRSLLKDKNIINVLGTELSCYWGRKHSWGREEYRTTSEERGLYRQKVWDDEAYLYEWDEEKKEFLNCSVIHDERTRIVHTPRMLARKARISLSMMDTSLPVKDYQKALEQNMPEFFKLYSYTHSSHFALQHMREQGSGQHIRMLHDVARRVLGYFGHMHFPEQFHPDGVPQTVLDVLGNWEDFTTTLNEAIRQWQ